MNLKKIEEERRALVSRLRALCLRERMLGGTVTRTMVGNSLRKEMRGLLRALSELQRTELRVSLGQESAAATSVRDVVPQGLRRRRPHSRG